MSTIQATDTMLVQRGTTQYSAAADLASAQDTDLLVINRAGVDYQCSFLDLSTKAQDTDLLLVNRAGVDYKCSFLDWKNSQKKAPTITSVTLADSPEAGRFTSGTFRSTVVADDGKPAATKGIKAWVQGTLTTKLTSTNAITAVTQQAAVAWDQTYTGLTPTFPAGDLGYPVAHFANGLLVVVGALQSPVSQVSWTSTDGNTWRVLSFSGTPVSTTYDFLLYGNGTWLSMGYNNSSSWALSLINKDNFATGWAGPAALTAIRKCPNGGCFANGLFWVACNDGQIWNAADPAGTWHKALDLATANKHFFDIQYANGIYMAVGSVSGAPVVYTSTDGTTWAAQPATGATPRLQKVVFAAGKWVATSGTGSVCYSTDDGRTWTTATLGRLGSSYFITYEGGLFIVTARSVPADGRTFACSADGIHWLGERAAGGHSAPAVLVNGTYIIAAGSSTGTGSYLNKSTHPIATNALTIAGCQTDGFKAGDTVSSSPAAAGPTGIVSLSDTQVVVSTATGWAIGQKLHGEPKTVANAKLYCKLNAGLTVADLQSADPGYTAVTGAGPYTVTFPATLPSGQPPDSDIPAGATITTEVQAVNSSGTVTEASNTVTPT